MSWVWDMLWLWVGTLWVWLNVPPLLPMVFRGEDPRPKIARPRRSGNAKVVEPSPAPKRVPITENSLAYVVRETRLPSQYSHPDGGVAVGQNMIPPTGRVMRSRASDVNDATTLIPEAWDRAEVPSLPRWIVAVVAPAVWAVTQTISGFPPTDSGSRTRAMKSGSATLGKLARNAPEIVVPPLDRKSVVVPETKSTNKRLVAATYQTFGIFRNGRYLGSRWTRLAS